MQCKEGGAESFLGRGDGSAYFYIPLAFDPSSGSQLCSERVREGLWPCWLEWEVGDELC